MWPRTKQWSEAYLSVWKTRPSISQWRDEALLCATNVGIAVPELDDENNDVRMDTSANGERREKVENRSGAGKKSIRE